MMSGSFKDLPSLAEVVGQYNLITKKSLGQHFLLDQNITDKIVRFVPHIENSTIIEVGPGPGGLTRSLLKAGAREVIVIEKDARCIQALEDLKQHADQLTIYAADALKMDYDTLGESPRQIVANLPYNISTILLVKWLHQIKNFSGLTLMFQKEVAERLTAKIKTKSYGRLSILSQWLCDVKILFHLSPQAFTPPPKVMSTVVQFVRPEKPLYPASQEILEKVVSMAFQQRRKMLRSALKPLGDVESILQKAKIPPTHRAEEVDIEGFCRLAEVVASEGIIL